MSDSLVDGRKFRLLNVIDDFNRAEFQLQMEGGKAGRELPGIVDQIITMNFVDFGDGAPIRAFVCTAPNRWGCRRRIVPDASSRLRSHTLASFSQN